MPPRLNAGKGTGKEAQRRKNEHSANLRRESRARTAAAASQPHTTLPNSGSDLGDMDMSDSESPELPDKRQRRRKRHRDVAVEPPDALLPARP